jgi:hypothetical protein
MISGTSEVEGFFFGVFEGVFEGVFFGVFVFFSVIFCFPLKVSQFKPYSDQLRFSWSLSFFRFGFF